MQKKSTKNIFLYPINHKFNKNIFESNDDGYQIISLPTDQSITKYFYTNEILRSTEPNSTNKPIFIINSSILNNEIISFIQNFGNIINIWIFVDKLFSLDQDINARYIIDDLYDSNNNVGIKKIPPYTINYNLYSNITVKDKIDQIVYFCDKDQIDIQSLEKIKTRYLYPQTKLRIKLFDNPKFENPQNLGFLSESDRKEVLLESKYYLHNQSNYYLTEALVCGCIPLNIDSDVDLYEQLKTNTTTKVNNINYYVNFLKELCNEG